MIWSTATSKEGTKRKYNTPQMGLLPVPTKPISLLSVLVLLCTFGHHIGLVQSDPDYATLVYKGCAKQLLSDPTGVYSQALSTVFGTLVSQSTRLKFFKTTAGGGGSTVTGLFQCRGDLSNAACYDCTRRLPILTGKLCGRPVAARVQLRGCYMLYEVAGFAQISGMELLYKTCGTRASDGGGLEERRDAAFAAVESGVAAGGGGGGFYTSSYQSMYVLGQCEGDVGAADCSACVKSADQQARAECGNAVSGQIYLHKCFISYAYYPNGVPKISSSPFSSSSAGKNPGKTVAIVLGGAAAVGFAVICALFARNLMKKKDDY